MRSILRKFLRFRWKLLFAATFASVATTVVVMTVVLVLFRTSQRSHMKTDHLPREVMAEVHVHSLQIGQLVQREPPDLESLNAWIASHSRDGMFRLRMNASRCEDRNFEAPLRAVQFAIVNEQGEVLASRPRGVLNPGTQLREAIPTLGQAVLSEALAGNSDLDAIARRHELENTFAAHPILDANGDVQGAVYVEAATVPETLSVVLLKVAQEIPRGLREIVPFCFMIGVVFSLVTSWGLLRRLRRLGVAAAAWSSGDFNFRVRDTSGDELGELGRNLDDMADQLGGLLETKKELAGLEERNHLARELHDTVKQELFSISLLLGTVEEMHGKDDAAARKHLGDARRLAQKAGRELNALILQLRPAALDGKGLAGALREYCAIWSGQIGIEAQVRVRGERPLPLEVEQGLFRVAQEALANVAWHSGSSTVDVHLAIDGPPQRSAAVPTNGNGEAPGNGPSSARPANGFEESPQGTMVLTIRDQGQGFDANRTGNSGYGLKSMQERIEHLQGTLDIRSRLGIGTTIVAECPLPSTK